MRGRRTLWWLLASAGTALWLLACAPAAPVRQATTGDATSTAPVVEPGPPPAVPIPTPAPPGVFPPLPPSILDGGERIPSVEEIMARNGMSRDEAAVERRRIKRELEARLEAEGRIFRGTDLVGTRTAGSTIMIAGKQITLPHDAYVENFLNTGHCQVGSPCGPFPVYILRRGDTRLWVNDVGKLRTTAGGEWGVDLPPGFEFLEALAE